MEAAKDALSGIGLLKYYAGDFGDGEESSLEYVAIVDTRANKVVSIEPHSWGPNSAQWNWQAVSVVVTDPDGNANEIQLRKVRQQRAAPRDDFWGFERPDAAPPRAAARAAAVAAAAAAAGACSIGCSVDARDQPDMTLFLASVRDPAEAELALAASADIVDLKDPGQGALGALSPDAIVACVKSIAARAPVSATIGDLPLKGDAVRAAMLATAALGVDYVKFGLFPDGDAARCLNQLKTVATRIRLIVVLFADALPGDRRRGACGQDRRARRDVRHHWARARGALPDHMSYMTLAGHIAAAKAEGLVVGLAGSLQARHVPSLLALAPDLLGFRGALCRAGDRAQTLDEGRLAAIRALIPERPRIWHEPDLADFAPQALC